MTRGATQFNANALAYFYPVPTWFSCVPVSVKKWFS